MWTWAELVSSLKRLVRARDERLTLEILLSHAAPDARFEERVLFLVRLLRWVRLGPRTLIPLPDVQGTFSQHARLSILFSELEGNEQLRRAVSKTLSSIIEETNALDLFAETGMPVQIHLFDELRERVTRRILPSALDIKDLGELFEVLFPDGDDAAWIETLDRTVAERLHLLLEPGPSDAGSVATAFRHDVRDALVYLAAQVSAGGSAKDIRSRVFEPAFQELAFVRLPRALTLFLDDEELGERGLLHCVAEAETAIQEATARLAETGVTVRITYELVRLSAELTRIRELVALLRKDDRSLMFRFVASLVRKAEERRDLFGLLSQSSQLWALKVVERSAQTGEHYITRTRREYREMLRMAALGGALTGVTTIVKFAIAAMHLPALYEGIFYSTNYALSFVAIQLFGGTLATKQPANTAPAIAARLVDVDTKEGMDAFVEEIAHLIRSQAAGIMGNVIAVVPVVIVVDLLFSLVSGHAVVSHEKAQATIDSLSILGPSAVYAAFTGILLWLGGFAGGMADNWVVFRRIGSVIGTSILFTIAFGRRRARVIGELLTKHFSGLVASATLGVLLGITPWLCKELSLPLDVRHVTLSTGFVAASVMSLGARSLLSAGFWQAVIGVAAIGTLNVVASFAMAMRVALSARGIRGARLRAVVWAVLAHLRRHPLAFFLPVGLPENTARHIIPRVSQISDGEIS